MYLYLVTQKKELGGSLQTWVIEKRLLQLFHDLLNIIQFIKEKTSVLFFWELSIRRGKMQFCLIKTVPRPPLFCLLDSNLEEDCWYFVDFNVQLEEVRSVAFPCG